MVCNYGLHVSDMWLPFEALALLRISSALGLDVLVPKHDLLWYRF